MWGGKATPIKLYVSGQLWIYFWCGRAVIIIIIIIIIIINNNIFTTPKNVYNKNEVSYTTN